MSFLPSFGNGGPGSVGGGGAAPNDLPDETDFEEAYWAWRRRSDDGLIFKELTSPLGGVGLTDATYASRATSAVMNGVAAENTSASALRYDSATRGLTTNNLAKWHDLANGDTVKTWLEFVTNTQIYTIGFAGQFDADPTVTGLDQYLCGTTNGTAKGMHFKYVDATQTIDWVVQEASATVRLLLSVDASAIGTNPFGLVATCDGVTARLYLDGVEGDSDVPGTAFTGATSHEMRYGGVPIGTLHYRGVWFGAWIDPRDSNPTKSAAIDTWMKTLG